MADSIQASPDDIGEPADPLSGDWSEGLPGPAKALDIPAPKLISLEGQPLETRRPAAMPAVQALSEEVETPDGWGAVGEDPLQSEPPPPLPAVMVAPEIHQEALLLDVTPTSAFAPDVTPASPAPAFLPDVTPASPTPVFETAPEEVVQEEVVDLLPEDEAEPAIAAEHQAAVQSEIETAEPIVEPEEPAVMELSAADAEPAEDVPVWDAETTISKAPDWEAPAPAAAAEPAPAAVQPEAEAAPAPDWGSLGGGPDWSAPPAAAASVDEAWGTPVAPAGFAQDAAWSAAAPAEPATEWAAPEAPAPAAEPWKTSNAGANTLAQLEGEPEPIPAEPGAAEKLFGTVPVGGSLAEEDENELPAAEEVEDPDLPVPVPEEENLPAAEVEDPDLPVAVEEPEPMPMVGLMVPGEHRVAVHTRGGRTRRGTMKNVDLALAQFMLQPQGGGEDEPVYHAEVKAIFFMLPPGASSRPGGHGKVKVTFADGRSIEGERDGSEGEHGFFLVPSDAARTNTWRIYIARDATSEIRDL